MKQLFNDKIWLAPMAGVTDLGYRKICKSHGADITVTEMVSAKALYYKDKKSFNMLTNLGEKGFRGIQIFGSDPQIMGLMTKQVINQTDYDFIDINMGCPAPKIVKNGEGSALMKNPELAMRIVAAVKQNSTKPVGVKMRIGFAADAVNGLSFAKALERAGADVVVVHGRTREQMYAGEANWQIIGEIAAALTIPVIGNGDIRTPQIAKARIAASGCAGVMIGRAVQGRPWLFQQIKDYLADGSYQPDPSYAERVAIIRQHMQLMLPYKPEHIIALEMRKHVAWYLKGLAGSNAIKAAVNRATTIAEIEEILGAAMSHT